MANKTPNTKPAAPTLQSVGRDYVAEQGVDKSFGDAGFGASIDFAGKDVDRYLSYGSSTYGKLGYDPFIDNNEFYNQNVTASQDIQRAATGLWKLAGVGFRDTFAFGATASKGMHKEFEQIMSTYGSTKKGSAGFVANTMLSSGYTVGIMGAIAAEELLLAAGTALSGGLAAPLTVGQMGASATRGASLISKGVKGYDKISDAVNIFKTAKGARTFWGSKQIGAFGKKLLPFSETFDFVRNADKLKDINGLQKSLQGVGAFARDMRKFHMTNAESKLEANMAKDEFRNDLIKEWNSDPANVGKSLTGSELDEINAKSQSVFDNTYRGNVALIYATNAITFDSMFKSMRSTNHMFGLHKSLNYTVGRSTSGKAVVNALEDTFTNYAKKELSKLTWKGTGQKVLSASMEGFQEVGQDLISGTAKRYGNKPSALQGNFWDSFHDSLGEMSPESFASGMVMGVFSSPVGASIAAVNKFTVGGGYQAVSDPTGYEKAKSSRYQQAKVRAKVLTEFFNDSKSYTDKSNTALFSQSLSLEKMTEAAENGDRKGHEDSRLETYRTGLFTLLESEMDQELIDYLGDAQNFTTQELNQAFGRTDITDDNRAEFLTKADNYTKQIKSFRKKYDEIKRDRVNPISIGMLDREDPEFLQKKHMYHAHEELNKELLFSSDKIDDLSGRMKDLYSDVTEGKFSTTALNDILTTPDMELQISLLESDIKSNEEYKISDKEIAKKKETLAALKKFKKAKELYDNLSSNDVEKSEDVGEIMFEAFNDYHNAITGESNTTGTKAANKEKFVKVWDYMNMRGESEVLQDFVNTMLDPTASAKHMERIQSSLKNQEENKEALIEESIKLFYEKKSSDEMMAELLKGDIIFNMNEIDSLIKDGVMPSKFFDVATHKELKGERLRKAQEVVSGHYKDLTGKTITASNKGYATRKKSKSDTRTSSQLLKQYAPGKTSTITLKSFVKKLSRSKNVRQTERNILEEIIKIGDLEGTKVVLTNKGDAPIEVTEDGNISIDVRFSSSDYEGGSVSFEYLATSALLQNFFTKKLDTNPKLLNDVTEFMEDVRQASAEADPELTNEQLKNFPVFKDPAIFLSESLNSENFQRLLGTTEYSTSADGKDVWTSLKESLQDELGGTFDDTMLERAVELTYLTLNDKAIKEVVSQSAPASEVKEEVKEKTKEEEKKIAEVVDTRKAIYDKINSLQEEVDEKSEELDNTSKFKWRTYNSLKTNINDLQNEIAELYKEVDRITQEDIANGKDVTPLADDVVVDSEVVDDSNGNLVITTDTRFHSLPFDLQVTLAEYHISETTDDSVEPLLDEYGEPKSAIEGNTDFDANNIGINPQDKIISLSEDDVKQIEKKMKRVPRYMLALGDFVNNQDAAKVKDTAQAEIIEDEDFSPEIDKHDSAIESTYLKEYIDDSIGDDTDPSAIKYSKKYVALGQELDNANATWEYTDYRGVISGRLVVEVVSNGKKFLMYRSTGKGSTKDSKGEWVPLLGFGRGGWFIKLYDKGKDPKLTKYGSDTFAAISEDLKSKQVEMFLGSSNPMTAEILEDEFPGITGLFSERQMINRLNKFNSAILESEIESVLNNISKEYNKKLADKKKADAKEENEYAEALRKRWKSNLDILNEGKQMVVNDFVFSIPEANVNLFTQMYPDALKMEYKDFSRIAYLYLKDYRAYSSSITKNGIGADVEDKRALQDFVDNMKRSKVLSSGAINSINSFLSKEKSPFRIKKSTESITKKR